MAKYDKYGNILIKESGFFKRFSANPIFSNISTQLSNLSNLGMKYSDMVVKKSEAIGTTEAQFPDRASLPEEFLYSLAMADVGSKKYIAWFDKDYKSRRDFLRKFAMNGEIEWILDTLADEAIVYDDKNFFCRPDTSNLNLHLKDEVKQEIINKVNENFKWIYNVFHFNDDISAWNYFRQLLIDGFLAFEIIYDGDGKKIIGFKELDATSLRPKVENNAGEYKRVWVQYEDTPSLKRVLTDSQLIYLSYTKSSLVSRVSYCERLVRSFNLLRIMENTRLIWNLMNSTFRMKMVVPIGPKSPQKAKESLNELLAIYKEDIYLDFDSGELLINGKPSMQFYKNYLFPSKNGESPEIETISADGPDLDSTESLKWFWDKLKKDSKIPSSRFDDENNGGQWSPGADGLDREEIRFNKFIKRLRSIFQEIIWKPLWIQMCLDYPELADDEIFRSNLGLKFNQDNVFEELKKMELNQMRLDFIVSLKDFTKDDGSTPYFNSKWMVEKFMEFTDEELKQNAEYFKADNVGSEEDAEDAAKSGSW